MRLKNCVNELWHRLLKDHKNLKLDLEFCFLLGPSTIHKEGLMKHKGAYSAYGCFLFLSLGLIKFRGKIKGGFGNKPMNCCGNYLFGCTLQLCLKYFFVLWRHLARKRSEY